MGWSAAALLGIPLLFAAVWCRLEVSKALAQRDGLLAQRDQLLQSQMRLTAEKTRLATWASLGPRASELGLRPPRPEQVRWVARRERGRLFR